MRQARILSLALLVLPSLALAAGKPGWVDGKDPKYPEKEFLFAAGYGPDRTSGENNAMANLAKIFVASVASASKDYQAAFSDGKKALEVQSVETLTQVSTSKVLTGVRIAESWEGQGSVWAFAVLERGPAAATLKEKIDELDKKVDAALEKADTTDDKVKKVKQLRNAAKDMQERMALNADLRIINRDGQGVPMTHSPADISSKLEGAAESLGIGVQVNGTAASDLSQALMDGLTQAGFQVKAMEAPADDEDEASTPDYEGYDLVIRAKSRMEKASVPGNPMEFARVVVDVEVYNPAKKKVITTFNSSKKEGHKSIEEAARRAVRGMKAELVKKIGDAIQMQLGPKG